MPVLSIRNPGRLVLALVLGVTALVPLPSRADSPLTSTDFHQAYLDLPQVRRAAESHQLDDQLADYLLDPGTSYDEAAAVINALGWNIDGTDNHLRLLRRLKATQPERFQQFRNGRGSSRELFVVGYLWAMDDYFETRKAESLLRQAQRQSPEFFAIALVHALIVAQGKPASEWCEVFRGPREAVKRYPNGLEMRKAAISIVLDYTDEYADQCR